MFMVVKMVKWEEIKSDNYEKPYLYMHIFVQSVHQFILYASKKILQMVRCVAQVSLFCSQCFICSVNVLSFFFLLMLSLSCDAINVPLWKSPVLVLMNSCLAQSYVKETWFPLALDFGMEVAYWEMNCFHFRYGIPSDAWLVLGKRKKTQKAPQ